MADNPDYDALAKRYLDLWQSQLSALSSDRQLTETMARLLATTNASMAAAFETARRAHAEVRNAAGDAAAGSSAAAAAGSPAAAAAPADGASDLGQLRARLDALEQRVAQLESRRRRTAKPKPAKPLGPAT
jgi:uncharacterized protein YceH (UPF0502 family)